jgi:hypothetical protein
MLEIGGSTWRILRIGRCLFAPGLTKDVIARQMITWHDATWVGRRLPDAPASHPYVSYPVMYCHASGEQAFLTPELAAEIDTVTAEKAGCETTELDREEKQVLAFGEDELRVPIVPKPSELAPEGYVAPVFKKVTKKNGANEDGDDEEDEEDEDEDEDDEEPKKAKGKSKETKKKSALDKDKELVSCPWFLGPLKRTGEHSWTPAVTIKTPAGGVSSAAAKKRPAAEQNDKADAPAPKKKKAAAEQPAPKATTKPATTKPATTKPATTKPTTKPATKPVAKPTTVKEAAKPPAAKPLAVLVPHDMFAPPPRFNAAHKQSQNGNDHSGDSLFVFKKGEHEENVRKFMAYMASSPESPEETRAMVKILVTSARKKPDSIKDNIFRIMGLPPGSWNTDGLSAAAQNLTERDQERARASFAAMRSVFAELLTCKKAAKKVDASEW